MLSIWVVSNKVQSTEIIVEKSKNEPKEVQSTDNPFQKLGVGNKTDIEKL